MLKRRREVKQDSTEIDIRCRRLNDVPANQSLQQTAAIMLISGSS
jgi:hypothetical protein